MECMELRHLRYFVVVAEELNFTRAAARLKIAQPPLSQQIKKLERELGVQLFDRSPRAVRLTSAGQVFVGEARALLARVNEATRLAKGVGDGVQGVLRIGAVPSVFAGVLRMAVPDYCRRFPHVKIMLYELEVSEQVERLTEGMLDIGLFRNLELSSLSGVDTVVVAREPMYVALPAGHSHAGDEDVLLASLADDDFVMGPRHLAPGVFDSTVAACISAGFTPKISFEAFSESSLLSIVAMGLAVSIVPHATAMLSLAGVVFRPLKSTTVESFITLGLPSNGATPQARHMAEIVMKMGVTGVTRDAPSFSRGEG